MTIRFYSIFNNNIERIEADDHTIHKWTENYSHSNFSIHKDYRNVRREMKKKKNHSSDLLR